VFDPESVMKRINLRIPEFGFIVATRAALAFGAGLLASSRIPESRRRKIGLALVALGVSSTIPAAMAIRRNVNTSPA
jgi:hypothetical protein